MLHFVLGPEHVGPLAADEPGAVDCYEPTSPRARLVARIKADLPAPRSAWRVSCTPSSRRMRCVAFRRGARYVREVRATIIGEDVRHDAWALLRLKRARR